MTKPNDKFALYFQQLFCIKPLARMVINTDKGGSGRGKRDGRKKPIQVMQLKSDPLTLS